ncbi:MAG: hypothetical protein LBF87_02855 [Treponema sp.]|nr:hypothetical protein [Treponema sp.]
MRILETKTQNAHSSKALFSARAVCMPLILIAALVPAACTSSASTKAMEEQAAKERAEQLQAVYARRSESTLAILPFTGAQEAEQGETIAELFSFNKDLNSAFTLIPRTSINIAIRNEQGFQMTSSMTDPDTSAALGKQLGAKYVLAGAITRLGNENLLIISILHVEDLRQIAGDLQTYGTIEEIRGKLPNMARNIVNALIADSSKLPLLAVPPVQWLGSYDNSEADIMAQALAMYLVQSGKYAVYPRTKSLEKVQEEYNNQFGGDVADEYLPHISMGDNPRLVLSVTARKLGNDNMFNAAIINLETGAQEGGESVDYQNLNDGIRVMEKLALKLTGQEERLAAEQERRSHTVNSASSFAQAISAINNDNAGGAYTITLKGDFSAAPVSFTENASKTITIKGDGIARTISNNGGKALFTVPQGISLVLDSGATLDGNGKTASLVSVSGGTLVMKNGSTVRRAKASGVYVAGGTFTMEGGIISGNTARPGSGGGVYVASTATFTMEGGTISGNTARNGSGGGVYVAGGTFTKRGMSTIDAINQAANEGKVVYVYDGSKTKARNSAAGPNVDMDSRIDGRAGGWE